ncbi:hypothetical protein [Psychromonas algarum]|nr:hypothetical protein [Psychromonas sp. RZ22]
MRQHHLANRTFNGYENIVDEVCNAWNDIALFDDLNQSEVIY